MGSQFIMIDQKKQKIFTSYKSLEILPQNHLKPAFSVTINNDLLERDSARRGC